MWEGNPGSKSGLQAEGMGPLHPDESLFPHSSGFESLRYGGKLPTAGTLAPGLGGTLTGHV